jgi:threonine dehydratase
MLRSLRTATADGASMKDEDPQDRAASPAQDAPTAPAVTAQAVREAHAAIAGHVSLTPCLEAKTLSDMLGCRLFLKFENLQFTASFKERGALNFLLSMDASAQARGVVAMSAGNHAQGVAYHAGRLGIAATIFMPRDTPFTKVSRTRALGADVRIEGASLSEATAAAREHAERTGAVFLHPFDDPLVIAGQGTVALEMLQQVPELDTLVVPVGGGGLLAGMAIAARSLKPDIALFGAEPEHYCAMHQHLGGLPIAVGGDTVAEGLAVRDVGRLTAQILRDLVEAVLLVDEAEIERAVCWLVDVEKTVVEGAGATGLAALARHRERFAGRCVGVPLTGGNIDVRLLASTLLRGLARDGRLVALSVSVPDAVGSLSAITTSIARSGGNIVEIRHDRLFARESARRATVELVVEAQDRAHVATIVRDLSAAGFPVAENPIHK